MNCILDRTCRMITFEYLEKAHPSILSGSNAWKLDDYEGESLSHQQDSTPVTLAEIGQLRTTRPFSATNCCQGLYISQDLATHDYPLAAGLPLTSFSPLTDLREPFVL